MEEERMVALDRCYLHLPPLPCPDRVVVISYCCRISSFHTALQPRQPQQPLPRRDSDRIRWIGWLPSALSHNKTRLACGRVPAFGCGFPERPCGRTCRTRTCVWVPRCARRKRCEGRSDRAL